MTNLPKRTKQVSADEMDRILGLDADSGVSRAIKGSRQLDKNWKAEGMQNLSDWMMASKDTSKTLKTWDEVYIKCGRCKREWREWIGQNPVGDDLSKWIQAAISIVTEKRWI